MAKKMNKLNVAEFKKLIKKGTFGYLIENIGIRFVDEKAIVSMISTGSEGIVFLNVDNKSVKGLKGEVDFIFADPQSNLLPYLEIVDNEVVGIEVYDNKIVIVDGNQKSVVQFGSPKKVPYFNKDLSMEDELKVLSNFEYNEHMASYFSKIMKIGSRIGKVYFNVIGGKLSIETTDMEAPDSNVLKFDIKDANVLDKKCEVSICIDFKVFSCLYSIIKADEKFRIDVIYNSDKEVGLILADNGYERYYMLPKYEPRRQK